VKRIVQSEFLDVLPPADPRAVHSRRDLRRINSWMRNGSIMAETLKNHLKGRMPEQIIELGAGDGTFLLGVAQKTASRWPDVKATLVDRQQNTSAETLSAFSRLGWRAETVIADVFDWLPASPPTEIIVANLFLHHFEDPSLKTLLQNISARAKFFVAIEPRRARLPLFLSRWLWTIGCNSVTRHDATVSVRAGFSDNELSMLWPDQKNWQLTERRAGMSGHLFLAQNLS
jgi:hypothetical protein